MRRSIVLYAVIILEALVCFVIYTGHHHITGSLSLKWAAAAFVATLALEFLADYPTATVILSAIAGALLGDVANIVVDIARGTSSHNLFPLELALRGIISLVGSALALPFAHLKSKPANQEKSNGVL
jgi:hypothetical protein